MSNSVTVLPPESKGIAYGLLFAVEEYMEKSLDRVLYAERDATAIRDALLEIGYKEVFLTVNNQATKTTIEYETKQLANTAKSDDTVFFFFAGHGYAWEARNYLLAHDTRKGDIVGTSVSLHQIFELFEKSACRRVMFFLDCCHSGMHLYDGARGVLEDMSCDELKSYFNKANYRVVFSACDKAEKSWPSIKFQHGYWTYHLLRALRGDEPKLLDEEGRLRSTQLQDYLSVEVPKQLKLQSKESRQQTPKVYGDSSGTFVVADLSALVARKEAELNLQAVGLKNSVLRSIEEDRIDRLDGFNKARGHRLPKHKNATTEKWVAKISEGDISKEMEDYFRRIQQGNHYSSGDLEYDEPVDGGAAIRTPDFEFTVFYQQSGKDPLKYEVTRELTRLNSPGILAEKWFNDLFEGVFDEAVFEFDGTVSVANFIASAESIASFKIEYNAKKTCCKILMKGFEGTIKVTKDTLIYSFSNADTPQQMAVQLKEARVLLLGVPYVKKALPL